MKTHSQGGCIGLALDIGCTLLISGKKSLGINDILFIALINGLAIEILSVDLIAYVLHHRQLGFHEGIVTTIVLMTHQAAFQLYMG